LYRGLFEKGFEGRVVVGEFLDEVHVFADQALAHLHGIAGFLDGEAFAVAEQDQFEGFDTNSLSIV
jgi:hypothetical protein